MADTRSHRLLDEEAPVTTTTHTFNTTAPHAQNNSGNEVWEKIKALPRWMTGIIVLVTAVALVALIAAIAASVQKKADANNNNNNNGGGYVSSSSSSSSTGGSGGGGGGGSGGRTPAEINACLARYGTKQPPVNASPRRPNSYTRKVIIQNGTVHDGHGVIFYGYDIAMEGGVIQGFGQNLPTAGALLIQANGLHVTPGLVDLHSHIGVYSWPGDLNGNSDGNELSDPITPYVRAIDGFNPEDPAIRWILRGGVTSSQVLPGSGNAMGGEAMAIKHKQSTYIRDLLIEDAPRAMKMATGENPKRVYGSQGRMPYSRMGSAYLMRAAFEKARSMIARQREWCSRDDSFGEFPDAIELHALVALLQQNARLHTHCYKIHDFQMILRLADEFGFYVSAFHHSSEAYKVPDLLRNISVATWSDWWGFKTESYDGSVYAPAILEANRVPVVIKSDDVVVSKYLAFEAAKAHAYGLSMIGAIKSITSQPAYTMGLQDRLGSIRVGLDADVVVWDDHPLVLGARPSLIMIDGEPVLGTPMRRSGPAPYPATAGQLECPERSRQRTLSCYAIVNVDMYDLVGPTVQQPQIASNIIVQNGRILCAGPYCQVPNNCTVFMLNSTAPVRGTAIPGLIESGSNIGQQEIDGEAVTHDGNAAGAGFDTQYATIQALDGIHVESRHVDSSRFGGVLTSINAPEVGNSVVVGLSTAYHTLSRINDSIQPVFAGDVSIKQRVALTISVGNSAKSSSGISASFSGQITALRSMFARAAQMLNANITETDPNWAVVKALQRELPVVFLVDSADQISALLRLQSLYKFRMIVQGGAEAYLLAQQLADASVAVVLTSRQPPSSYETLRQFDGALGILQRAGVVVGVQAASSDRNFNLRWELGWQQTFSRDYGERYLTTAEALRLSTRNLVEIYGLDQANSASGAVSLWAPGLGLIQNGTLANFVILNGNPLGVESTVQLVALGANVECRPRQWRPYYTL